MKVTVCLSIVIRICLEFMLVQAYTGFDGSGAPAPHCVAVAENQFIPCRVASSSRVSAATRHAGRLTTDVHLKTGHHTGASHHKGIHVPQPLSLPWPFERHLLAELTYWPLPLSITTDLRLPRGHP